MTASKPKPRRPRRDAIFRRFMAGESALDILNGIMPKESYAEALRFVEDAIRWGIRRQGRRK